MVPPRPIRKPANTRATSHRPRRNHFSDRRNTLLIRLILLVRLLSSICRLPSAICRLSIDQSSIIDDLIHHHSHLPTTIRSRVSPSGPVGCRATGRAPPWPPPVPLPNPLPLPPGSAAD